MCRSCETQLNQYEDDWMRVTTGAGILHWAFQRRRRVKSASRRKPAAPAAGGKERG